MGATHARYARAFAPGHVTGLFRPALGARDPRARGSVGAGIVLELGAIASASFRPGPRRRIRLDDGTGRALPISEEVARRLAPEEPGALEVRLTHELPVGQGFGMSAAGALATALAVDRLAGRDRERAISVAHLADLFGGGGLGGVAAILGGGLEARRRPGIPPFGAIVRRPCPGSLFVGVVGGPIPSPTVLGDPRRLHRIDRAAEGLSGLVRHLTPDAFFAASERFTDAAGLATPEVARAVRALRRSGAWAAQAMFGRSFLARPKVARDRARLIEGLQRAGLRAVEVSAARAGARVLPAQAF
ncbi:MAG TPA: hypothetical protein VMG81_00040 [Thermoplasmata archaeon]|nr:hypothetical protein [Thermoplasmata archaeon]